MRKSTQGFAILIIIPCILCFLMYGVLSRAYDTYMGQPHSNTISLEGFQPTGKGLGLGRSEEAGSSPASSSFLSGKEAPVTIILGSLLACLVLVIFLKVAKRRS